MRITVLGALMVMAVVIVIVLVLKHFSEEKGQNPK
jgi:hypothetical protein